VEWMRVPSIPYPFNLFGLWSVLLKGIDLIANFQGNNIPMDKRVVCGSRDVCEGGYACPIRVMGVAAGLRKRVDCVAVDDEWEWFPYAFLSADGAVCHGFSASRDRRDPGLGRSDGRGGMVDQGRSEVEGIDFAG
jgi:hypothetical protein